MSNGDVVTMEQIKALILFEKLRPEQLFSDAALKDLRDTARAEGYAEGMFAAVVQKDQAVPEPKKQAEDDKGLDPHLDPAKNPLIKMG